jgi:hypothetical protein
MAARVMNPENSDEPSPARQMPPSVIWTLALGIRPPTEKEQALLASSSELRRALEKARRAVELDRHRGEHDSSANDP